MVAEPLGARAPYKSMEIILHPTVVLFPPHKQAMHVVSLRKQMVLGPLQEFLPASNGHV